MANSVSALEVSKVGCVSLLFFFLFYCQTAMGVSSDPVRKPLFIYSYLFFLFFQDFTVALSRRSVLANEECMAAVDSKQRGTKHEIN